MKLTEMNRNGCRVSVTGQVEALRMWFEKGDLRCQALASELRHGAPAKHKHYRNADALLQKMRKAGVIEWGDGAWHLSDTCADNIDDLVQSWGEMQ